MTVPRAEPEHREATAKHVDPVGGNEPICPVIVFPSVVKFLLWCVLLVLCWPLAVLALLVYPIVWVLLIPFRLIGIAVDGVLGLLRGIVMLPARLLRGPRAL
jgi:hypothetical protein